MPPTIKVTIKHIKKICKFSSRNGDVYFYNPIEGLAYQGRPLMNLNINYRTKVVHCMYGNDYTRMEGYMLLDD